MYQYFEHLIETTRATYIFLLGPSQGSNPAWIDSVTGLNYAVDSINEMDIVKNLHRMNVNVKHSYDFHLRLEKVHFPAMDYHSLDWNWNFQLYWALL